MKSSGQRLPLIHHVVDVNDLKSRIEKLTDYEAFREVLNSMSDVEKIDGKFFKLLKVKDRLNATLLAIFVECPWQVYLGKRLAENYGYSNTILTPIPNIKHVLLGLKVHEQYLNYLESNFNIPTEVRVESEFQVSGKSVRVVGKVDALILEDKFLTVLEVKTSGKVKARSSFQACTYMHIINNYIGDKVVKPLVLTLSGFKKPTLYSRADVLQVIESVYNIIFNSTEWSVGDDFKCVKTRCPYYPYCPKRGTNMITSYLKPS